MSTDILIRRLESTGTVAEAEKAALRTLTGEIRLVPRGVDAVRAGDLSTHCCVVLSGLLFRYGINDRGRRQIMNLYLPGDVPDLQYLFLEQVDHALASSTNSRVLFVPHDDMRAAMAATPNLIPLLWRHTSVEAAIYREWLLAMGQSSAKAHLAHLFCELSMRQLSAGLEDQAFSVPITQTELADVIGVSDVHVNRTLQDLRAGGLIEYDHQQLRILNWPGLKRLAQFDAAYLHLQEQRVLEHPLLLAAAKAI